MLGSGFSVLLRLTDRCPALGRAYPRYSWRAELLVVLDIHQVLALQHVERLGGVTAQVQRRPEVRRLPLDLQQR
jgi:hypothetical protein